MVTIFGEHADREFMRQALIEAQKAFDAQEVPVGAVIVDASGSIVARAYNQVECQATQAAHAEIGAASCASRKRGDWRLEGCWLYVTLQPCAMCMHFIKMSRFAGLVYGADSPLFGYHLDNLSEHRVYKNDILQIIKGVYANESAELLRQFFKAKRK